MVVGCTVGMSPSGQRVFGLNNWARAKVIHAALMEQSGDMYVGSDRITHRLFRYRLRDGSVYTEKVQTERNDLEGCCVYFALRDQNGAWVPESLWSDEEEKAVR